MNRTWGFAKIYVSTRNIYNVEKIKLQSDATCPPDLFYTQSTFIVSNSTFSSLFPCLAVYLTFGGGPLLLFIGID